MAAPTSRTEAQKELFAAARQGDVGRCRTLLAAGDVEVNDVVHALSGVTALHAGVAHKAVVKLLIGDFRADVNRRRRDGSTALMDACEVGDLKAATALLDTYGADPHIEDKDGHTALDLARENEHSKVAKLVEDRGGLPGLKRSVKRSEKTTVLGGGIEATPLPQSIRDRIYTAPHALNDRGREVAAVAQRIGLDARAGRATVSDACDACGKTVAKLNRCSRCRAAAYCSARCQRTAWPQHKEHCRRAPKAPAPAPVRNDIDYSRFEGIGADPAPAPAPSPAPPRDEWALFDEHSSRKFGKDT